MSQLGYMFMAVGAEAYQAGLFHMLTHAFFKALLFLSSGAVILGLPPRTKHLQDGRFVLQEQIPICLFRHWWRCIGSDSIPHRWFFSKDAILGCSLGARSNQSRFTMYNTLYWVGVAGAFLTSIYTVPSHLGCVLW